MSDPLTALMHAVQVMNLLKTLITKALREREESAANGGYSPLSSHSSDGQTDEEFDVQHEMDTSCELRRPTSDYDDDHAHYTHSSEHDGDKDEDDDEVQSPSMIQECFLRRLDEKEKVTEIFQEETARDFGSNMDSAASFTDSKNGSSGLSTSDGEEDSGASCIVGQKASAAGKNSPLKGNEDTDDVEMVDKLVDSSTDDKKMVDKLFLSN